MSRFAVPISEKELRMKILEVFKEHRNRTCSDSDNPYDLEPSKKERTIYDLLKRDDASFIKHISTVFGKWENTILSSDFNVEFDFENVFEPEYRTRRDGVTFMELTSGGDWEIPVFFCLYHDGENLRAYIPENGNTYNTVSMTAVGSEQDDESFVGFAKKRRPEAFEKSMSFDEEMQKTTEINEKYIPVLDKEKARMEIDACVLIHSEFIKSKQRDNSECAEPFNR